MGSAVSCGTVHGKTALSLFTTITSIVLCICTMVVNGFIILAIYKSKRRNMSGIFYSILLNIACGDLMTGLITDVVSVSFHLKESISVKITIFEVQLLHMSLFVINGASVLSMALLSIDRIFALCFPFGYREGIKPWKKNIAIVMTWVISIAVSMIYRKIGYIKHLAVFSCTTLAFTTVLMIATFWLYYDRLIRRPINPTTVADAKKRQLVQTHGQQGTIVLKASPKSGGGTEETGVKITAISKSSERRITMSFIIMLIVFALSYLPTFVMILYMNVCTDCNCTLIHVMRDLTFLFILSSALSRGLNFLFRLSPLRRSVVKLLHGNNDSRSTNEATASIP